jgi:acyl-CoA synthetase (AMP-forming)/AMP-acid ligase II
MMVGAVRASAVLVALGACGTDGPSARTRVLAKIPAEATTVLAADSRALSHPRTRAVVDALRPEVPAGLECVIDAALIGDQIAAGLTADGDLTIAVATRAPVTCAALSRVEPGLWIATDDIINVAGHRLSTGGMEEVLSAHQDVAECAVLGIRDELKGEVPCGFIVLKAGVNRPHEEIERECVALVRDKIGPVAAFKLAITVARLPKTRSGKILRGTIKKIADGEPWNTPATIEDPAVLDEIGSALKGRGVGA